MTRFEQFESSVGSGKFQIAMKQNYGRTQFTRPSGVGKTHKEKGMDGGIEVSLVLLVRSILDQQKTSIGHAAERER